MGLLHIYNTISNEHKTIQANGKLKDILPEIDFKDSFVLKAGHIAMITRGVTEDALPENVLSEGKKAVKERFATITAFIFITRAIKNIFRQIGRIVTKVGTAVGGETGGNIASIINSAVQVLLGY